MCFRSSGIVRLLLFSVMTFLLTEEMPTFAQDHPAEQTLLPFQTSPGDNNDEQLAMQYFQNKEYDKAAPIFDRLYNAKSNSYFYTYYYFCLIEMHDFDGVEKLIKTARKKNPDALSYLVDLGYLHYRKGESDKATKYYEDALKKITNNNQQIYELANAFMNRFENEYAIRVYLKGRQLSGDPGKFGFELASVYERVGDMRKMLDEFVNLLVNNRSFLPTVQDHLQFTLANDPDGSKNELFRTYLLEKAQKEPEKAFYSELLWWYSIQQKDFDLALIQAKSLDRRFREDGSRVRQLARLSAVNDNFEVAQEGYKYLISKGPSYPYYNESRIELLNTRYLQLTSGPDPLKKNLEELKKEFQKEIENSGENSLTIGLIRNLAHLDAFFLNNMDEASSYLNRMINRNDLDPLVRAGCKLELADILLFTDDVWEAALLYQQVYKDYMNDEIGQEAKFKNARLSFYIGEFKWALDQLDVLKAATSKLIANDAMDLSLLISENFDSDSTTIALGYYAHADLLEYRNQYDQAIQKLDSVFIAFHQHSIFDRVIMKKAEIQIKQGKYAEADTLLGTVVSEYSSGVVADKALMMRARLNEEQMKNPAMAMQYYEALITKFPGSVYANDARNRFRFLRGDKGFQS
ncbi:MAG: tetratricopeptide repeat protein [Bacteroidota bacterium]|nr:tetratricopeptide repeat protein [Bacteroidota bacterium]